MELAAPLLSLQGDTLNHDKRYHYKRDGETLKNTWIDSMFIVIANVVGIGVLGLPHAFSKLGWLWGVICLAGTLCGSLYSGLLMTRMKCKYDHCVVYADLGYEAFGNLGKAFITLFGYTYIVGFSFQLTASLFLKDMMNGLCFVYCSIMVSAIVLPLAQYRNFAEMNSIAVVGAVSIIFPVILIVFEIAVKGHYQPAITSWVSNPTFDGAVVACMDVVFALAGHVFFVEIMSVMREPREFKKSLYAATTAFSCVYFLVAFVGYSYIGSIVTNPITANLSNPNTRRWCSAFILCHIVVAYVMAVMVLARAMDQWFYRRPVEQSKDASYSNRVSWLIMTSIVIFGSFLVSNILPFVNDLLGFVGAISGVTTTFVFPFLLAPILLRDEMSLWHARILQVIAIASTVVSVVGVVSSVHRMSSSYQTRTPFSC